MEVPPQSPDASSGEAPPPVTSLPVRMANVLAAPGEVFDEVASAPQIDHGNWIGPAILLILVGWICGWIILSQDSLMHQFMEPVNQAFDQQIKKNHVPEQQAEQMKSMGAVMIRLVAVVGPPFLALFNAFWSGFLIWILGTKVFGREFSFFKALEIGGLTSMILVLQTIIKTLLQLALGSAYATPSLVVFLKPCDPQNSMYGFYSLVDVTIFWLLFVRAMGLARLARVSLLRAGVWVFGIWLVVCGSLLGFSLMLQRLAAHAK